LSLFFPFPLSKLTSFKPQQPLHRFTDHIAAVKAIAWNPHQHGILASGGGTADQKLRFWNTLTGNLLQEVDTGSQVRSLSLSSNRSDETDSLSI
jgi:cell division cycle 20-like protein 1 (cofactor of APC complex)